MTQTSETSKFVLERLLIPRILDVATTGSIGVPLSSPVLDSINTGIVSPAAQSEQAGKSIDIVPDAKSDVPIDHQPQMSQNAFPSNQDGGKPGLTTKETLVIPIEDLKQTIIYPPPFKVSTSEEVGELIVRVLERYRLRPRKDDSHTWAARSLFLDNVTHSVEHCTEIRMALPAFPFKSPNKITKVLGALPDHGEQVALLHLDGMCHAISDIYKGGAKLYIVSDGLIYNVSITLFFCSGWSTDHNIQDLLGISDQEVWNYGQALRKRAGDIGCRNIRFIRLVDLLQDRTLAEPLSESDYIRDAPTIRDEIYRRYIPQNFDVDAHIAGDRDAMLTYCGYLKFLEVDLEKGSSIPGSMTKAQAKKCQEQIAKNMIRRGKVNDYSPLPGVQLTFFQAFANAISGRLSSFIRLSIHSSTEATKLSISLIPQGGISAMTPWHSSLVRALDGSIHMAHALRVPAKTHELIFDGGRPSYFRESSHLFNWRMEVDFNYLYPCGILITPRDSSAKYSLHNIYMQNVRALAEMCSPVILRGFLDTMDRHTFVAKSYDAGKPLFGISKDFEARPAKCDLQPSRISLERNGETSEAFGQGYSHLARFRYIVALADAPPDSPCSLFASSKLFWQHLPPQHSADSLAKLTWSCENTNVSTSHLTNVPLVVPHPTDASRLCVRWHDTWHHVMSGYPQTEVCIDNGSQYFVALMDSMLSDRRVCLHMKLMRGDIVLSDNIATMHDRTAHIGEECSRFWRIDLD